MILCARLQFYFEKKMSNKHSRFWGKKFIKSITFMSLISLSMSRFVSAQVSAPAISSVAYTFTLNTSARTSAGVYTNSSDSSLVRTLWSNVTYQPGTYNIKWDGKDDNGNAAVPGNYTVRVVSNNVNYTWEGVIGNNSTNQTGPDVWAAYGATLSDMVEVPVAGHKFMYCTSWFAEASAGQMKFDETTPHQKSTFLYPIYGQASLFTCASSTKVFYAGWDYNNAYNYVMATSISNDALFQFSAGSTVTPQIGQVYNGVIDLNSAGTQGKPSGMAVQQGGNQFLFVAHAAQNVINVYKTSDGSGSLVTTIPITAPTNLELETDNIMWVAQGTTLTKYIVNANGSITATKTQITGFSRIAGVSVLNGDLCVLDAGNQQIVKRYNSTSLAPTGTIGQVGGYASSPAVADNKFYEEDLRGTYYTFVRHQSDGSIWICDPGNCRYQHFTGTGAYIDNITFLPMQYGVTICLNQPTQVFSNYMEYTIDYNKPLATGWTLTNNWGYNVTSTKFNRLIPFQNVILMPNNRRYALCNGGSAIGGANFFCELTNKGLRIGANLAQTTATLTADGTMTVKGFKTISGAINYTPTRYSLTGFDNNNDPIYGPGVIAATIPMGNSGVPSYSTWGVTNSNILTLFDNTTNTTGTNRYHLSGYDLSNNKIVWRASKDTYTAYTGPYPMDGTFDVGNSVQHAGNECNVVGNNIFWGYHGEFWKNSETGMLYHYNNRGLLLGLWGVLGPDVSNIPAPAGYAANTLSLKPVQIGNSIYIYGNDEEKHSGLHRWKVTGLNTIQEQDIPIQLPSPMLNPATTGSYLLAGLSAQTVLANGAFGWTRSNGEDYTNTSTKYFTAISGTKSYLPASIDLYVRFRQPVGIYTVSRTLGNNSGLASWVLSGQLSLDRNFPNDNAGTGGSYIEILDNNGKIIARFYQSYANYLYSTHGNDQILNSQGPTTMVAITQQLQPFEISAINNVITFKYAGYSAQTSNLIDPTANWRNPTTFRLYFWTNANAVSSDRNIDFQSLMFTANQVSQTLNFDVIPQKSMGDAPFPVFALSSANLPVTYSILSGPATISGNTVTITGSGTVTIQASQTGNSVYGSASPATQTFIVGPSRVDL
jgi:hypothetical protein